MTFYPLPSYPLTLCRGSRPPARRGAKPPGRDAAEWLKLED